MHHHAMQQRMHANEMQMLRNETKARGNNSLNFSTKLSETSPPLASIAKMGEKLEGQYKLCISQQESGMQYTYPTVILGRRPTILRHKDC